MSNKNKPHSFDFNASKLERYEMSGLILKCVKTKCGVNKGMSGVKGEDKLGVPNLNFK
jgi:hypothetical protein